MVDIRKNEIAYGLRNPLQGLAPRPKIANRDPNNTDKNYDQGTIWVNQNNDEVWVLTKVSNGVATWEKTTTASENVSITKYVVDANDIDAYTTVQSALDAANTAGGNAAVYIRPGTYTENLTLYDTVEIVGATSTGRFGNVTISGAHTLPATGDISIRNIQFNSNANQFTAAGATAVNLSFEFCRFNIATSGRTVNIPGSANSVVIFNNCTDASSDNGLYNNTSAGEVYIFDSQIGTGDSLVATIGGDCQIVGSVIGCAIGAPSGTHQYLGSEINNLLNITGTSTVDVKNSVLRRTGGVVITHNSSNILTLTDVTIDCNAAPDVINGAGILQAASVTYLQNSGINAAITLDVTSRMQTPVIYADRALRVAGDVAGEANTVSISNVTDEVLGAGVLTINGKTANPGSNSGFLKVYNGTNIRYIPYFTNISP